MNRIQQQKLAVTVKRKREQLGLSQQELSDRTQINRAMISRIENGTYMPSIAQLEDLMEVLGLSFEDLQKEKETEKKKT